MLENIDAVAEMMAGISFAAYRGDFKLRRAVERCVEIVSEASRKIPDEMKSPNNHGRKSLRSETFCAMSTKEWTTKLCGRLPHSRCPSCGGPSLP
jgi:hypothetical protein